MTLPKNCWRKLFARGFKWLWNVIYYGVLRLRLYRRAQIMGIADYIALMIRSKYLEELVRTCNNAVRIERSYIMGMSLKLAEHKTDTYSLPVEKKRVYYRNGG